DGNREHVAACPPPALDQPLLPDGKDFSLQNLHPLRDIPAVELELGLARTAGRAEATALALEVGPAAHQARGEMLQARQLDLQLALARVRALREDLEDQLGAAEHAPVERELQVALLGGRKLVVED